ncbi:hypothetical protein, partial [Nocardioides sp.]|uniref:hypothetical protein n=1 Tax=Nocardioides sp. TaxID=35761 RepID=UPI002F2A2890
MVRSRLLWLVPAALVVMGSLGVNHDAAPESSAAALGVAVLAGAAMVLASFRGRSALVVGGAAVGAYFATGLENGPIFVALPLTVLAAALRVPPRPLLPAVVGAPLL